MTKKIHTLKNKEDYAFSLVGISTTENDYRISWILNNILDYQLVRQENLDVYHKKLDDAQSFHQFSYFDEDTLILYRLISNRCEMGYLVEEMSNIDYLLQVSGEFDDRIITALVKKLNSLKEITLAIEVDPNKLKSRKKLLL